MNVRSAFNKLNDFHLSTEINPAFQCQCYHIIQYARKRLNISQYKLCEMQCAKKQRGRPTTSGCILQYTSQHTFLAILTHYSLCSQRYALQDFVLTQGRT